MGRTDVHEEMKELFGLPLPVLDRVPDEFVASEWELLKRLRFGETVLPNKYKELIGLAVAATLQSRESGLWHSEMAGRFGACDAEIHEALHLAKLFAGWSVYLAGLDLDLKEWRAWLQAVTGFMTTGAMPEVKIGELSGEGGM